MRTDFCWAIAWQKSIRMICLDDQSLPLRSVNRPQGGFGGCVGLACNCDHVSPRNCLWGTIAMFLAQWRSHAGFIPCHHLCPNFEKKREKRVVCESVLSRKLIKDPNSLKGKLAADTEPGDYIFAKHFLWWHDDIYAVFTMRFLFYWA